MTERTIRCPRCGEKVSVPTGGEKVRCSGCGQKLRFDPARRMPEGAEPPEDRSDHAPPVEPPPLPSPRLAAPPGPPPSDPPATASEPTTPPLLLEDADTPRSDDTAFDAEELHELWPALCRLIAQAYETGQVSEADRVVFRTDASRAAALARKLLPREAASEHAYEVLTSVLPNTSPDEILSLTLEQFRHLQESLDEAQGLIDRQVPNPGPEAVPAPEAVEEEPVAPSPSRHRRGFPVASALTALLVLAAAAVIAIPQLRVRVLGRHTAARLLGREENAEPSGATSGEDPPPTPPPKARPGVPSTPTPEPATKQASPPRPEPPRKLPAVKEKREPPATPSTTPPEPKTSPEPKAEPPAKAPAPKRYPSRWKPGPDGWIRLFDGKSLDGWQGADRRWRIHDGEVRGNGAAGVAFINAREADWTDYALALKVMLGPEKGEAVISHGVLAVQLGDQRVRLGYPQRGWRTLDQKPKGLARLKWYDIEFDVKGKHAEVRINDQLALRTDAHSPLAGAPALEALSGGVAFRNIRVKLHESDPDYAAVAQGQGYAEPPSKRHVKAPSPARKPERVEPLGPGVHDLFEGRSLESWETRGTWAVRDGAMLARARRDEVAVAYVPATAECRDYVLRARCRLLREGKRTRLGEYLLLVFRLREPDSFYCMRFPIEGIFELGCYHDGRFREVARGVRKGHYNEWHEIELSVRGNEVEMRVDGLGGLPTWKYKYFTRGAVGVGVTGGDAAFKDIRVRILR